MVTKRCARRPPAIARRRARPRSHRRGCRRGRGRRRIARVSTRGATSRCRHGRPQRARPLLEIAEAAPETRVLLLSQYDDPAYVRRAFGAGATGYLLMEAADTELVHAIREVPAGTRTCILNSERALRRPRQTRSLTASTRCCTCSLSDIRIRRSRSCSSCPCALPKHTGAGIMQKLGLHTRVKLFATRSVQASSTVSGESRPLRGQQRDPTAPQRPSSIRTAAGAGASSGTGSRRNSSPSRGKPAGRHSPVGRAPYLTGPRGRVLRDRL